MKYSYNYAYLRTYASEHRIAKKDMLKAFGCSDYVTLNKWLDGMVPIHVNALLRFCNYYRIPLDGFFCDDDSPLTMPVNIGTTAKKGRDVEAEGGYSYNENFLSDFMHCHGLKKLDLLEALGSSDYTSLNKWLNGDVPIHVCAMLRLCNYYSIPLDRFFLYNGRAVRIIPICNPDAQKLPTDGYGMKEGRGRGIVETLIGECIATSDNQRTALEESFKAQEAYYAQQRAMDGGGMSTTLTPDVYRHTPITNHPSGLQDMEKAWKEREAAWNEERKMLLEIIERQNTLLANYMRSSIY